MNLAFLRKRELTQIVRKRGAHVQGRIREWVSILLEGTHSWVGVNGFLKGNPIFPSIYLSPLEKKQKLISSSDRFPLNPTRGQSNIFI